MTAFIIYVIPVIVIIIIIIIISRVILEISSGGEFQARNSNGTVYPYSSC